MKCIAVVVSLFIVLSSATGVVAAPPEGKVVLGKPLVEAGRITVPVYISSSRPLLAFSFKINYDSSLLTAKSVENAGLVTEDFEFFSARPEPKEGWIRVGGLTSFHLNRTMPSGEYQVANVWFELNKEKVDRSILFELGEVELVDVDLSEFKVDMVNTMAVPIPEPPPRSFALYQNDPNPFETDTRISYSIPVTTEVKLNIYNVAGQLVIRLVHQMQEPGYYTVVWNGRTDQDKLVPSGMYFYRLETPDFKTTKKMIVAR